MQLLSKFLFHYFTYEIIIQFCDQQIFVEQVEQPKKSRQQSNKNRLLDSERSIGFAIK